MEKKQLSLKASVIVLVTLLLSLNMVAQVTIDFEGFESGSFSGTIWNDGGSDCSLNSSSLLSGTYSANLQDNSGSDSAVTTNSLNLNAYSSVNITFDFKTVNFNNGEDFYIEFSDDGGSSWYTTKIAHYIKGTNFNNDTTYNSVTVALSSSTYSFTSNSKIRFRCDASSDSDDLYLDNILIEGFPPAPEINVTGLGYTINGNGTNLPSLNNNTDFGTVQITSQTVTKTFVIENLGGADLTLGSISLVGPSEFTIDSIPVGTISPGETKNLTISFSTSSVGVQTDVFNILSDDSNESPYQINISAEGKKVFFDSDGDGIFDDVDIDDDNDGILDSQEQLNCSNSPTAKSVNYKFLEETFGAGPRTTINTTYDASTTYCYEDGSASCPSLGGVDLNDGEYTVGSSSQIASWAADYWYTGVDHTSGDTNGRMAMFNAAIDPGIFYTAHISGTFSDVPITYSFWVLNLDRSDAPGISSRLRPDILVEFRDMSNNLITSITTGDIAPTTAGNETGDWYQFTADLNLGVTEFKVIFINNQLGGTGNDLAIDDIEIKQTLCDIDNDGIADVFDLDSDNDGIPDVVEAGLGNYSEGKATLTGVSGWVDANENGVLDLVESNVPVDSDADGIPNYLDLDSDNDGLFDIDEYGVIDSNDPTFQNGDGDVTGDGVGDGAESETFRKKDSNGDDLLEGYGDGILDCFDFFEGNTDYADSFGNNNQGTGPLYAKDSDADGLPDYIDVYNDITGIYDIDTTEIYAVLPHSNGVLNDNTDTDSDGIVASRDGDDAVFGSPRNLNASYSLFFDGRNDYVEDGNLISSGEATLMTFVKSGGSNTSGNDRIIAGQDDLYIAIDQSTNTVRAVVGGNVLASSTPLIDGIWTHIAVTTKSGNTILYVNGIQEASDTFGGVSDTSNFFIGKGASGNYYKGEIDEVRVFNKALSTDEVKQMVYQELDASNGFNQGTVIPLTFSASIGNNLVKYYKMDAYKDDILDDIKTTSIDENGAKIYNVKTIYFQRAPLPYQTVFDGNWTNPSSWLYGTEWDITSKQNNPDDASIVHIKNNIHLDGSYDTQGMVGLIVDTGKEFSIEQNKGLYNSWYLKLDGLIDLDDESQLIQTANSILDATSAGKLERDQQGTKDLFTYNYWSSPVGISNTTTNNNDYKLPDVLFDGSIPASPMAISFLTSGYNGKPGTPGTVPISIADYWIWKYANKTSNNYASWQHIRSTGTVNTGEGFTMKGVTDTNGSITQQQNYVFIGKPNNGDITLTLSAGNDYLIGNPYASAIDADEFIKDNISVAESGRASTDIIDGALYFWDHFASKTHVLAEYQGGYGTYTLIGGAKAISNDSRINATGAESTKTPQRFIPVGQGFFVTADKGGEVVFKNSQRIFKTEIENSSVFMKTSGQKQTSKSVSNEIDSRPKIRLLFDSPNGYHRQILVGADEHASNSFDLGYDAPLIESNKEDMYWMFDADKYIIQGVNNFNLDQKLPLGITILKEGLATIKIDQLENMVNHPVIFIHDKQLNSYHNLTESDFNVYLPKGTYTDRFEVTFSKLTETSLGMISSDDTSITVYYSHDHERLIILNPTGKQIKSAELFNLLGQSIYKFKITDIKNYQAFTTKHLNAGTYIVKLKTPEGVVSKKILINN